MSQTAAASENSPRPLTSLTDEEQLFRQSVGNSRTSRSARSRPKWTRTASSPPT